MTAALAEPELDPAVARTGAHVDRHAATRERVTVNTLARLGREFDAVPGPGDGDRITARLLGHVQDGQRVTARTSAAYMAGLLDDAPDADRRATTITLPPSLRVAGRTDPAAPYRRPFAQWARDLDRGVDPDTARARARQRLMVMADADLTAAMREGVRQSVADHPDVIGMRRVIHPELSRGGACGLCVAASDRMYSKRILMPVHDRCVCEPMIVTRSHDPGLALNEHDWDLLYGGAEGDTSAAALKRTRYVISHHGERGPTLRRADDTFTGPDPDAAAVEHGPPVAPPDTPAAIESSGDPRQLSSDDLDAAMQDAIGRDDWDRFDELQVEADRRDAEKHRSAARREAEDQRRAEEFERRMAAGDDEETAVADVYGISVDRQRRDRAMALLRQDGYVGDSFDALARASLRDRQNRAYWEAEDATRGVLLSNAGRAAGIDPMSLFVGPESRVRKWASDELKEWFDQNGRPTLDEWRAELLGATGAAATARASRADMYA